ncbi:hypothetical protein [Streptomyces candidus]|uniref:Uncharacterized protein n=1 Tax=Streptomyces candidus TaxID=67283 RepID=A0A7X0HJN7_9ACTN|nr:hypothetical protein [Streptomyces candidus]MBB6438851.1 hypothetical protein [Streptomyces candidus]GHH52723.1 hypothetical protein GCM10018773_53210 [Streptomyces candidus]
MLIRADVRAGRTGGSASDFSVRLRRARQALTQLPPAACLVIAFSASAVSSGVMICATRFPPKGRRDTAFRRKG